MLKIDLFLALRYRKNIPFVVTDNNCREQPHPCYVKRHVILAESFFFPPSSAAIKVAVGFVPVCVSERRGRGESSGGGGEAASGEGEALPEGGAGEAGEEKGRAAQLSLPISLLSAKQLNSKRKWTFMAREVEVKDHKSKKNPRLFFFFFVGWERS